VHRPFATTAGYMYTVTFLFSGNGKAGPTVKVMEVSAAEQTQQFTWDTSNNNNAQNGDYQIESWTFMANGPKARLSFRSLDPKKSPSGPVIAAISVTPSTP
jgi:Protein of unknown function (DUF642)